jgi:hypothetical protein
MSSDRSDNSLADLLSDFLLSLSKVHRETPADHPLLRTPALRVLAINEQPAGSAADCWPTPDQALAALGDYWKRVFKPDSVSPALREAWREYLVLEVAYFLPFRQRQVAAGGRPGRPSYPQSYSKLGELLSDAEYLAGVVAAVSSGQPDAGPIAELCRSLIPDPNDRARGAMPASTVKWLRGAALESLASSLEDFAQSVNSAKVVDREAIGPLAVAQTTERTVAAPPELPATRLADGPTTTTIPTKSPFVGAGQPSEPQEYSRGLVLSPSLGTQARRLAQQLAAIGCGVEPTAEPTPRLTDANVQVALRRVGASSGDWLLDALADAGLLRRDENWWAFVEPALAEQLAAEYAAEYGVRWVSLHPRHHTLMKAAATILARRADDGRNAQFCQYLGRALGAWSPVSLLDAADILAPFRDAPTPATARFGLWLVERLRELTPIPSGWLQAHLWQVGQGLGAELGLPVATQTREMVLPAATLTAERQATDLPRLLDDLGLPARLAERANWFDDRRAIRALLECIHDGLDATAKRRAAAWLWLAQLEVSLEWVVYPSRPWKAHRATALEALAELTLDPAADEITRALARSVLARDECLLALAACDRDYCALLFTLQLALDKRLFIGPPAGAWQVASADQ